MTQSPLLFLRESISSTILFCVLKAPSMPLVHLKFYVRVNSLFKKLHRTWIIISFIFFQKTLHRISQTRE